MYIHISKMSESNTQEEPNHNLKNYYSAIESYENLESLFNDKNSTHFLIISNELNTCYDKLDAIITGEGSDCPYLVDLFQLKQNIINLRKIVDKRIQCDLTPTRAYNITLNKNESIRPSIKKITAHDEIMKLIEETIEKPRIDGLKDIAGLWEVKKALKALIVLPKIQPQLFVDRKICNSVLLFGPPGTGKTRLVHALAFEAEAVLHCVSVSSIVSPLVGQSEKNLKGLFEYLRNNNTYSILFIDEIDGFCKKRNDSEQEHSRRMKTELMCQLSKMEEFSRMFLICATNCPWDLDTAFLRRFQKRIYIPLPNANERQDLFKLFMRNIPLEMNANIWKHLIDNTEGFSGSDISNLIQHAINIPILELEDTKIWKTSSDGYYEPVTAADDFSLEDIICCELGNLPNCSVKARNLQPVDFINSLENINVTISKTDIKRYEYFISK